LWDYSQTIGEKLPRKMWEEAGLEEIAIGGLAALEKLGRAVRHTGADGNLTWKATPEVQACRKDTSGATVTIRAPSFDRIE
jgi:hypothetical protein